MTRFTRDQFIGYHGIGVQSVTDTTVFDGGREFTKLIFYIDSDGVVYDLLTGNCGIGCGNVDTLDEFWAWYSGVMFMMKNNPDYAKRLEIDNDPEYSGINRFREYTGCCVANAVIKQAEYMAKGIRDGSFELPSNVVSALAKHDQSVDYVLSALDDLASIRSFPVTSLTVKELEKFKTDKNRFSDIESAVGNAFRKVMEELRDAYKEEECADEDAGYFPVYPDDFK